MSLLIDYFVAPSDAEAGSVAEDGPNGYFPLTDGSGIEPTVNLGTFEELLTGKTFDQQLDDPDSYPVLASARGDDVVVVGIASDFVEALAGASDDDLQRLAVPWSQSEELDGLAAPEDLVDFLVRLRTLAQDAVSTARHVYCWVSV